MVAQLASLRRGARLTRRGASSPHLNGLGPPPAGGSVPRQFVAAPIAAGAWVSGGLPGSPRRRGARPVRRGGPSLRGRGAGLHGRATGPLVVSSRTELLSGGAAVGGQAGGHCISLWILVPGSRNPCAVDVQGYRSGELFRMRTSFSKMNGSPTEASRCHLHCAPPRRAVRVRHAAALSPCCLLMPRGRRGRAGPYRRVNSRLYTMSLLL